MNKYIKEKSLRYLLYLKLTGLANRIENTNNLDSNTNGEFNFVKFLNTQYKDSFSFFDIGGNIGKYTEIVDKNIHTSNKNFYIFEPQEKCIGILKGKFKNKKYIKIEPYALGEENSSAILYKDKEKSGLASLSNRDLDYSGSEMPIKEEIKVIKGSDFIKENNIKHINLLKIDVEGHELDVLEGLESFLSYKNIDYVQFEYGGTNLDSKHTLLEIYKILEKRGFIIHKMMKKNLVKRKYHPKIENFMYKNYVAISSNIILNQ